MCFFLFLCFRFVRTSLEELLQRLLFQRLKRVSFCFYYVYSSVFELEKKNYLCVLDANDVIVKSPIWYRYKEGFNNAVRKDITISDLL